LGRLSSVDLAVLLATLALAVGVGLRFGRGKTTARSYLVGEHDVPWWAVLLSIVATETSGVTFLSVPGRSFVGDLTFLQLPLGYVVGRFAIARWLLPAYFEGDALTSYEVLGRRFGGRVKRATSLLFLLTRNLSDGLRLYVMALPLQKLTDWPMAASIAAVGAVTIAYTFVGGMKAVVWTDVVQFFVYVAGGLLVLWVAVDGVEGGLGGVLDLARREGKLELFDFAWRRGEGASSPTGFFRESWFFAGLLGGTFLTLATHGTDQLMVQRYLCARNGREAGRALVASGFVVFVQFALFLGVGLALHAFFASHPPSAPIVRGDDALPTFVATRLVERRGAVGLVLGAVFAVSMSTLSSSLNASAGALVNDWWRPAFGRNWSDADALRTTKRTTAFFGLVQIACGIGGAVALTSSAKSVVDAVLSVASATTGLTLGLFLLAKALPAPRDDGERASQERAALVAFVVMLGVVVGVWCTPLAWPWYSLVGSLGTLAVGRLRTPRLRRASEPPSPRSGRAARA
jgi:SSS family transporter